MAHVLPGLFSGLLVGAMLGLVGGGGSILAVPLLAHFVGVSSPHVAIGTSALAVALNALSGLAAHARSGAVKWRCSALFSASGVIGAMLGSSAGKAMDGQKLLALFGALMIVVGVLTLRARTAAGHPDVKLTKHSARVLAPRLVALGVATGFASGFFGIGGGFLIVPALMLATGMPVPVAMASSLVSVAVFGVITAASYASSGLVDWPIAGLFIVGGTVGGWLGRRANAHLVGKRGALSLVFAAIVVTTGSYVISKALRTL